MQRHARGERLQRFEASWLLEEGCDSTVREAWEGAAGPGVRQKLGVVVRALNTWSREVLGDLWRRIKKLKGELERVRREPISESQVRKEQTINFKLERLQDQEDLVWRQRAHGNWLTQGDRNTKFFQAYASERKKKNAILKLKREDGVVVEDEEGIKNLVTNYFTSLFTPVAGDDANDILDHISPKVTPQMNDFLAAEFTPQEVKIRP